MKIYAIRDHVALTTTEHFIAQNDEEAKRIVGFTHRSDPFIADKCLYRYAEFCHSDVTDEAILTFQGVVFVGKLSDIVPEVFAKYAPADFVRETGSTEVEDNG